MMRFYDLHLGAGVPPAAALRRAQLWLRDASSRDLSAFVADMARAGRLKPAQSEALSASIANASGTDKPYSHSLFWAAFQYYGG